MRLQKLRLNSFRPFSGEPEASLELDHSAVLLCGPNATGKSSVFHALELLLTGRIRQFADFDSLGQVLVNVEAENDRAEIELSWESDGTSDARTVDIMRSEKAPSRLLKNRFGWLFFFSFGLIWGC